MYCRKASLVFLSFVLVTQGHNVEKRFLFGGKKTTTTTTTTTVQPTLKPALGDIINTLTDAGKVLVKESTGPLAEPLGQLSETLETVKNIGNEVAQAGIGAMVAPLEIAKALALTDEELKKVVTTEEPITTTEAHGFMNFLRTGLKNVPILNVVQDTLVKTVDNVVDLPGNLVESVKTGNPLEIVKSAVKVLPVVDEAVVDKAFDAVQDQIVNLPHTLVEGAKQGANLINATAGVTGSLIGGALNPLTGVVSTAIEKGNSLLNATGHLVGMVVDPIAQLGIGAVNTTLFGTGNLVGKVAEGTTGILDGLLSVLGLPLLIIIVVVGGIILICLISVCVYCICKCVKNRKETYVPYTPGKGKSGEESEKLLP